MTLNFNLKRFAGAHLMIRKTSLLAVLTGCLGCVVALPSLADEAALQRRIDQMQAQQKEFMHELERLRAELAAGEEEPPGAAHQAASQTAPEQAGAVAGVPRKAEPGRIDEVERKQSVLTGEVRKLREALVLPEKKEMKSVYGLGPAASKVYQVNQGLSIGGYGEANFRKQVSDKNGADDEFDFVRFVLYFGYKYNDWIVFNSEVEFEHAGTESTVSAGEGAVSVEFAALDFLLHPAVNVRAGMMLAPVGFMNQIHEPPFYYGNRRPPVERQIIPTTWRANGVGLFGQLAPGLTYNAYGVTSLNAVGFSAANLRDARQGGNRAKANDWSFIGRLDYEPIANWGWTLAGSAYIGDQGQNELIGPADMREKPGVFTQLYEVHTQIERRNFHFRALGTTVLIDDAGLLSADPDIDGPIAKQMLGAYAEVAYDILPHILPGTTHSLSPWFRYSWLDTQNNMPAGFTRDRSQRRQFFEFGLQYKPVPQVVLKAEYRIEDRQGGDLPDGIQLGGGFVF